MQGVEGSQGGRFQSPSLFEDRSPHLGQHEDVQDLAGAHDPVRCGPTRRPEEFGSSKVTRHQRLGLLSQPVL